MYPTRIKLTQLQPETANAAVQPSTELELRAARVALRYYHYFIFIRFQSVIIAN
jgi:hypothetical protein